MFSPDDLIFTDFLILVGDDSDPGIYLNCFGRKMKHISVVSFDVIILMLMVRMPYFLSLRQQFQ